MRQSMKVGFVVFLAGDRGPRRPATCMGPGSDRSHRGNGDGSERCADHECRRYSDGYGTGVVRPAKTNDAGAFNVTRLPPGTYELKVSAPGFQTSVHQAFTVVLNQTARVDVQMKVGQSSESRSGFGRSTSSADRNHAIEYRHRR